MKINVENVQTFRLTHDELTEIVKKQFNLEHCFLKVHSNDGKVSQVEVTSRTHRDVVPLGFED